MLVFKRVVLAATLLAILPVLALQAQISEEEYGKAMTEVRFLLGDAGLHIDARYWPELNEDIEKLRAQFGAVEAFWAARGTDEAVAFIQASLEKLGPIEAAADAMDIGAAQAAVRDLRTTCQPCHDQYREETADGFQIKQ
jgi:hypothetical protein